MNNVDPSGLDALDDTSNFFAGWGDTLTFGGTRWVRQRLGANDVVDAGSGWYTGGQVVGTVHQIALTRDVSKLAAGRYAFRFMTPFKRGRLIERLLGAQKNLRANFPVIDRFSRGVATSIKSLDLNAKSYQKACKLKSTVKGYINKLDGFQGHGQIRAEMIKSKRLVLALNRGASSVQKEALKELAEYAREKNISLVIEWF